MGTDSRARKSNLETDMALGESMAMHLTQPQLAASILGDDFNQLRNEFTGMAGRR
jgi:hypothetical protein